MKDLQKYHNNIIVASATFFIMHSLLKNNNKKARKRRWWMTSIFKSRIRYSASDLLLDLQRENSGHFENFTRLSSSDFEILINKVGPKICKQNTYFREAIPVKERLSVTLRFLATGDSYTSLSYLFKISKQIISKIIPEVTQALIQALHEEIRMPSTSQEWLNISSDYFHKWNFPHCLGAIDGKHVVLQSPINSGSEYYNYKSDFSIVLMAVVDANYKFIYANVGCQGRISDGGVFKNTAFYKNLDANKLSIPQMEPLPKTKKVAPYVFVADDAFPLTENLMKPYPRSWTKGTIQRALNYRLSRARRVVENVFGIMSSVFRVLRKPMLLEPEKAELIVLACVYLHNFLRNSSSSQHLYCPEGALDSEQDGVIIQGSWRSDNTDLTSFHSMRQIPRKSSEHAKEVRNMFAEYCSTVRLPWQDNYE